VIGRLIGIVVEDEGDGTLVLDVAGVGYELTTPLGTLGRARKDAGNLVTLHVHTHVREDALELFGFASRTERTAFRTLISIAKVGPKLAMAVLSSVSVQELVQLVATKQTARLTKIPGVGKKTAERMVLELEGKFELDAGVPAMVGSVPPPAAGQASVLHDALVRMGFKSSEAERAVAQLPDLNKPLGELVREALGVLSP
jgi:Holliday junction DNA helicase RuvA